MAQISLCLLFQYPRINSLAISIQGKITNIFALQNAVCDLKTDIDKIDNAWLRKVLTEIAPEVSVPDFKFLSLEGTISDSLSVS